MKHLSMSILPLNQSLLGGQNKKLQADEPIEFMRTNEEMSWKRWGFIYWNETPSRKIDELIFDKSIKDVVKTGSPGRFDLRASGMMI